MSNRPGTQVGLVDSKWVDNKMVGSKLAVGSKLVGKLVHKLVDSKLVYEQSVASNRRNVWVGHKHCDGDDVCHLRLPTIP